MKRIEDIITVLYNNGEIRHPDYENLKRAIETEKEQIASLRAQNEVYKQALQAVHDTISTTPLIYLNKPLGIIDGIVGDALITVAPIWIDAD